MKTVLLSAVFCFGVAGCGRGPEGDPFDQIPSDRWKVEEMLREVAPELKFVQEAILAGERASEALKVFLREGAPEVGKRLGDFERMEFHVERAFSSPEGDSLEMLLSYEGLLSGEGVDALACLEGAIREELGARRSPE